MRDHLTRFLSSNLAYYTASMRGYLIYKSSFWMEALGTGLLLVIQVCLWNSIEVTGNQELANHIGNDRIIAYVTLTQLAMFLISGNYTVTFLSERVRKGSILIDLLRPVQLMFITLSVELGRGAVRLLYFILPNLLFAILILKVDFSLATGTHFLYFLLSFALAYLLSFQLSYLVGICSLWIGNIWGVKAFYDALVVVLGGSVVPIILYPEWVKALTQYFPFQSIFYTPFSYLSNLPPVVSHPILLQFAWLIGVWIFNAAFTKTITKKAVLQGG